MGYGPLDLLVLVVFDDDDEMFELSKLLLLLKESPDIEERVLQRLEERRGPVLQRLREERGLESCEAA